MYNNTKSAVTPKVDLCTPKVDLCTITPKEDYSYTPNLETSICKGKQIKLSQSTVFIDTYRYLYIKVQKRIQ